jgi:hypothetical protein
MHMKKYFVIVFSLLMLSAGAGAQIKFGLKGGISSSTIKVDDLVAIDPGTSEYYLETSDATLGFHVGVFTRIKFFNLFLQPELLFASSGGEIKVTDIDDVSTIKEQTFNKIQIPVMLGFKLGPAHIAAGPVASFILSTKSDMFDTQAYVEDFKKATFGYQAGVGIDILKKLTLDLKYEGSLSNVASGVTIDGTYYAFDERNSQLILSLGIFF